MECCSILVDVRNSSSIQWSGKTGCFYVYDVYEGNAVGKSIGRSVCCLDTVVICGRMGRWNRLQNGLVYEEEGCAMARLKKLLILNWMCL